MPDHNKLALRNDEPVICAKCGKRTRRQMRGQKYCSRICRERARKRCRKAFLGRNPRAPATPIESPTDSSTLRRGKRPEICGPAQVIETDSNASAAAHRAHLEALLTVLDATRRAFRRDSCGYWVIKGKRGHIYADGKGFLIVVGTEGSIRLWTNTKRKLGFCQVTQDGDDEGCLHLDHLPTPAEADLIRDALKIRRKRHYTPDQLATIAARLRKNATRDPLRVCTHSSKKKEGTAGPKLIGVKISRLRGLLQRASQKSAIVGNVTSHIKPDGGPDTAGKTRAGREEHH